MNYLNAFDKTVKEYLSDCYYSGASDKTISNYKKRLSYFRDFWAESDPNCPPTSTDVRDWRESLIENGLSASTVRQYLVELRAFFEYAKESDSDSASIFQSNPITKKMLPKRSQIDKHPYEKVLEKEDIMLLFKNGGKRSKRWPRDYAIIMLLLDGKIRNAELLDLKLSDVDFEHNEIVIQHGKGDKYRVVTLRDISISALKLYLESGLRPKSLSDDDYLFGTTSEHKFGGTAYGVEEWHRGSTSWLSKLVEKHIREVTGKAGFRSHSLRHNGAIIDLNNGMSMERIQAELGHSSIQTTEIYAGRLMSVRKARDMQDVYAVRDEWAERNYKKLARM